MENRKAYVCVHRLSGHIFKSRDVVFDEGSANAPTHMNIDDLNLNVEETKWSAAGTVPEAIGGNQDIPDEDGKTTKGDQPPDGVSIDGNLQRRSATTKKCWFMHLIYLIMPDHLQMSNCAIKLQTLKFLLNGK